MAETPIPVDLLNPMIDIPTPPLCDDSAVAPLTSYGVQNVAHRLLGV
jgi:hypothetical protein